MFESGYGAAVTRDANPLWPYSLPHTWTFPDGTIVNPRESLGPLSAARTPSGGRGRIPLLATRIFDRTRSGSGREPERERVEKASPFA